MSTTKTRSTSLMKLIQTKADGGEVRITLTEVRTLYAHVYPTRAAAMRTFATEMGQADRADGSLDELSARIEQIMAQPIAGAEGASVEAALEALIKKIGDG